MTRAIWVAATACLLAACGAMPGRNDLSGPPGAIYQSGKAPAAFAQCLLPRWQAERVAGGKAAVESAPAPGDAVRMTLKINGTPGRVVEIAPQGTGSTVRYWNRSTDFGSGKPAAVEAIEGCR